MLHKTYVAEPKIYLKIVM